MSLPVLICDDSNMARKQMARALPQGWDVQIHYAANGEECLEALRSGQGDLLFLDLNMPVLDGYGVLEAIQREDLPSMVVVVSGDIQPEARARVLKLGALAFIKKPTDPGQVAQLLEQYGIYRPSESAAAEDHSQAPRSLGSPSVGHKDLPSGAGVENLSVRDGLQELSNVAMGRAGDLLARLLGVFIKMPIPRVNMLEASELRMALSVADSSDTYSAVCQGFIGAGVAGEALLLFADTSFDDVARLLRYDAVAEGTMEVELLMDMSSILVGAFLKGLSDQTDIPFSMGHPSVLGQHLQITDLLEQKSESWRRMLSIEINYSVEEYNINCDLLLLFTEDSLVTLEKQLQYLMD